MKILRLLSPVLLAALVVPALAPAAAPAEPVPLLVGVRPSHHPGFDRLVFRFEGGVPSDIRATYVDELIGEFSGLPVRVAGRAVLGLRFEPSAGHTDGVGTAPGRRAFALPNLMELAPAGDFEAVTAYGVGMAKETAVKVTSLTDPYRVVVDVRAAFDAVDRKVWFLDADRFVANTEPFFTPRLRPVRARVPAVDLMDRIFAGPLPRERAHGMRLLRSRATGWTRLRIADQIARVQLVGGCSSGGSTVTVAGHIMPTLKQLPRVRWVKIYDPAGTTEYPTGPSDSIPECLEP